MDVERARIAEAKEIMKKKFAEAIYSKTQEYIKQKEDEKKALEDMKIAEYQKKIQEKLTKKF